MYCKDCHYCLENLGEAVACPECGGGFDKENKFSYYTTNPENLFLGLRRILSSLIYACLLFLFSMLLDLHKFLIEMLGGSYAAVDFIQGLLPLLFVGSFLAGLGTLIYAHFKRAINLENYWMGYVGLGLIIGFIVLINI